MNVIFLTDDEARQLNDAVFSGAFTVEASNSLRAKLIKADEEMKAGIIHLSVTPRHIQLIEWGLRRLHSFARTFSGSREEILALSKHEVASSIGISEYKKTIPEIEDLYNSIVENVLISDVITIKEGDGKDGE